MGRRDFLVSLTAALAGFRESGLRGPPPGPERGEAHFWAASALILGESGVGLLGQGVRLDAYEPGTGPAHSVLTVSHLIGPFAAMTALLPADNSAITLRVCLRDSRGVGEQWVTLPGGVVSAVGLMVGAEDMAVWKSVTVQASGVPALGRRPSPPPAGGVRMRP